ncbi:MAG: hypothetical protein IPG34_12905 [Rhodocyclaceae bacterium]|nr:hypothetical protein [Rhodocyclaceae bacterium]
MPVGSTQRGVDLILRTLGDMKSSEGIRDFALGLARQISSLLGGNITQREQAEQAIFRLIAELEELSPSALSNWSKPVA